MQIERKGKNLLSGAKNRVGVRKDWDGYPTFLPVYLSHRYMIGVRYSVG